MTKVVNIISLVFLPFLFLLRHCESLQGCMSWVSPRPSSFRAMQCPSPESEQKIHIDGINTEQKRKQHPIHGQRVYLFSLNWIEESDPEYFLKKDAVQLWKWKDITLGDGHDFLYAKPKTLMALQQYILGNIPNMSECSIISNCARLEVLCSCSSTMKEEGLSRDISRCFATQLDHHKTLMKNGNTWDKIVTQLPINVDRPESTLTKKPPTKDTSQVLSCSDSLWNVTVGSKEIIPHVCKISAGMATRPRRPDRPVVFRPFASRDAYVLMQLKRTRENIAFSSINDDKSIKENGSSLKNKIKWSEKRGEDALRKQERKILPVILDYALRAGKAARNPDIVPEIEELREMTSAESAISSFSELQTSQRVANAAYEKGIQPLVDECMSKLDDSMNNADRRISEFRCKAFDYLHEIEADDVKSDDGSAYIDKKTQQELRLWLNRRLHEPTNEIRSLSRRQNSKFSEVWNADSGVGAYEDIDSYINVCLNKIRDELSDEHCRCRKLIRSEKK